MRTYIKVVFPAPARHFKRHQQLSDHQMAAVKEKTNIPLFSYVRSVNLLIPFNQKHELSTVVDSVWNASLLMNQAPVPGALTFSMLLRIALGSTGHSQSIIALCSLPEAVSF